MVQLSHLHVAIGKTIALRLLRNQWLCSVNTQPWARPNLSAFCELTTQQDTGHGASSGASTLCIRKSYSRLPRGLAAQRNSSPMGSVRQGSGLPRKMSFSRFPALSFPPYSHPGVPDSAVVPSHPPLVLVINRICFCYSCRQTWLMLEHLGARDRGESLVFYLSISRSYVPDSLTPVQVSQPGCTPQGSQGQAVNLYLWL